LTRIDGIGPAYEKALNALGVVNFAQLAVQDPEELAERMDGRVTADRIRNDRWIEQAQALVERSASPSKRRRAAWWILGTILVLALIAGVAAVWVMRWGPSVASLSTDWLTAATMPTATWTLMWTQAVELDRTLPAGSI
jgi:hypothetical protein